MRPPGPRGLPVLGSLPDVRRDPPGVFLRAALEYGEVASVQVGARQEYLITNPAAWVPFGAGPPMFIERRQV